LARLRSVVDADFVNTNKPPKKVAAVRTFIGADVGYTFATDATEREKALKLNVPRMPHL
jgi:hypothetical protein